MIKSLSKDYFTISVIAIVYSLIFNSDIIISRYQLHSILHEQALKEALLNFFEAIIVNFAFFYTFSANRTLFLIIAKINLIISALLYHFYFYYKIKVSSTIIGATFEANLEEILGFINYKLYITSIIIIILCILLYKFYNKNKFLGDKKLITITASFCIFLIFMNPDIYKNYYPYNYLVSLYDYFLEKIEVNSKKIDIAKNNFIINNKAKDLRVVVVIGEAARSDHLGINGYKRNTTPYLSQTSNLFSFKDSVSCATMTRDSVPCLMSRATINNLHLSRKETSLISIYKKLGFLTRWIGSQGNYSTIDDPLSAIYKEAHDTILIGSDLFTYSNEDDYDENLIPFTREFIEKHKKSLLVLHTYGSHWHYESRYPRNFEKYKPICTKKTMSSSMDHCSDKERINSYDNSILYTDYILNEIISILSNKNAILFYTSDHGESLGENGIYLHGGAGDIKEQKNVPIIVWTSDIYKNNFPELYQNLKNKNNKKITHDNIFHSVLGCSTIESKKIISDKLNLCAQ